MNLKPVFPTALALMVGSVALPSAAQDVEVSKSDIAQEKKAPPQNNPLVTGGSEAMNEPLDGSSLEVWDARLEELRDLVTVDEYQTLENALNYLLIYDLSARRDRKRLAANLNGMTPNEVISKVQW